MISRKRRARTAGLLYVLMAVTAVFSLQYIPSVFIVAGDAAATADRITSGQFLYRLGIVSDLLSQIVFVFLVLALYHLLKDVSRRHAILMVALVLVSIPLSFVNTVNMGAPLILLSGADFLSAFDEQQLEALALGALRLRSFGINAVSSLWGLWLIPFGLLVYRSGFIPRILGVLLIIGGSGYMTVSLTSLLFPAHTSFVNQVMLIPYAIGELAIVPWLLFKGERTE